MQTHSNTFKHTRYWYVHVRCFQSQEQGPAFGNHVGNLGEQWEAASSVGGGGNGSVASGKAGHSGQGLTVRTGQGTGQGTRQDGQGDGKTAKDQLLVHLMTRISLGYVKLLGSIENRIHHSAFFRFYPFALAEAVYQVRHTLTS